MKMTLLNMNEMLTKASLGGYAVCAFNVDNMELIRAVVEAAEAENAPVIVQIAYTHGKEMGLTAFTAVGKLFAETTHVPIALHLDHGTSIEECKECLEAGFTSVMIDASSKSYQENVSLTRKVVELAKEYDASVEGAVGYIPEPEDNEVELVLSDPKEVQHYCETTGVDCVSIAIGTVHYMREEPLKISFEILQDIRNRVDAPLVLHGGAALTDEDMKRVVRLGISKYNVMYKTHKAFLMGVKESLDSLNEEVAPGKYLVAAFPTIRHGLDYAVADCQSKIRLLGGSGKA
jgi:fructose-bisphosphate aldolase class II